MGINYKKITGGALRESNKIIYFFPDTASKEYILYNFNLNLGDTLFQPFGWNWTNSDTVLVTGENSIETSKGFVRTLSFNTMALWIEGVGSQTDFYNSTDAGTLSGSFGLECMIGDSGFHYPLWTTYCIFPSSDPEQEELRQKFVSFRPNPFHSIAIIEVFPPFADSKLTIYNLLGTQVKRQKLNTARTTIERNGLPEGIYLYFLENNIGQVTKGKIIIE